MDHPASDTSEIANATAPTTLPTAHFSPPSRPESPSKATASIRSGKRKRDKYTEKACNPCKARKIKCGGGTPCAACVRRKRPCVVSGSDNAIRRGRSMVDFGGDDPTEQESVKALQSRMEALESHLQTLNQALLRMIPPAPKETNIDHLTFDNTFVEPANGDADTAASLRGHSVSNESSTSPKGGLTFTSGKSITSKNQAGETSMLHALRRVEDRLTELGLQAMEEKESAPETPPMTPLASSTRDLNGTYSAHGTPYLFHKHGITLTLEEWNVYLDTYLVEVHPLYPFLSEDAIRNKCDQLWRHIHPDRIDTADQEIDTEQIVQGLLILANGRCATSSRIQSSDGSHSAGWSLYCIAMEMQGSLLETINDDSKPMSSLQTLTLVVIYLLRLDAAERAQKILSLAIVHAQHLGIHLEQTHADMSKHQSELFKRVWWCLYVLDRRIALVLGRPFLICDSNVGIGLIDETDEETPMDSISCGGGDCQPDLLGPKSSAYHYLNVMVGYSRVVGKVWEALFGAESREHPNPHVYEYLDSLVHTWMESVPSFLMCDMDDIHRSTSPISPSLFKQRFLVQLVRTTPSSKTIANEPDGTKRYLNILNVIRSPIRLTRKRTTMVFQNSMEADIICLQRARCVVNLFGQCSLADGVYGFPFLPYLLEATIIILACLTRLPNLKSLYKETVDTAISMLKTLYRKTWVSGKMARMIFKLGNIIPQVFSCDTPAQEAENSIGALSRITNTSTQSSGNSPNQRHGEHSRPWVSKWSAVATSTSHPTDHSNYQHNDSFGQDVVEQLPAASDFRFADFPFELSFDIAIPQTSLVQDFSGTGSSGTMDGLSDPNMVGGEVDWLQELMSIDGRHHKFP